MDLVMEDFGKIIVFLHVFGAIVWVGGMIVVRFAVHPSLQKIEDPLIRVARSLEVLENLFRIVLPLAVIIVITGILLQKGLNLTGDLIIIKQGIWTVMFVNFVFMIIKRNSAQKHFIMGDLKSAGKSLAPIPKIMVPLNIVLGILALYLGVTLRGF